MKRFAFLLALVLGISVAASAGDKYTHDDKVLPEAARTTISNNCKAGVSVVKTEKTLGRVKEYEVTLTDGTEITFDRNGNWENVETAANKSVPNGFVPKSIKDYVGKYQSGARIVGIEKDRKGYEVELSNGVDMKFDTNGKFLRYEY